MDNIIMPDSSWDDLKEKIRETNSEITDSDEEEKAWIESVSATRAIVG